VGSACCDLFPKSFKRFEMPRSPLMDEQPEIDIARQSAVSACDLSFIRKLKIEINNND